MRFFVLWAGAALAWAQQPPVSPSKPVVNNGAAVGDKASLPPNPALAPPPTVSGDAVVITAGGEKLTKAQFELIIASLPDQERMQMRLDTPLGKKQLADRIAELLVLTQEARARKIDKDPKIVMEVQMRTDQVLASELYRSFGEDAKPDEATLRAYYSEHKSEWEEVRARHILIRFKGSQLPLREGQKDLTETEALAKITDLRAKIVAGADFAEVAKAESDDTGSGANGGDLGSFGKNRMVPAFEAIAFSQPAGTVSQPVKTQFGYHIIKVESHTTKSFEEVRPEVEKRIAPEMARKALEDLKKKNPTVYNDAYFAMPAPPAPIVPPPVVSPVKP